MRRYSIPQVMGVVEQIKRTDGMIKSLESKPKDAVREFDIWQFKELKKDFIKELLAYLVQSDLDLAEIESFIKNATAYLKKFAGKEMMGNDLKTDLKEVERMMVA